LDFTRQESALGQGLIDLLQLSNESTNWDKSNWPPERIEADVQKIQKKIPRPAAQAKRVGYSDGVGPSVEHIDLART
jgi:hypothetical protein